MSEEALVASAIDEALTSVDPPAVRERVQATTGDQPITPAVLTIRAARAPESAVGTERVLERAAAVQLSYEGLVVTRELIREEPWVDGDADRGDVDVVAAEMLVSRGVEMLAHSGVVEDAVAVVQRFGRDQTRLLEGEEAVESTLERDTLELAVVAGADLAVGTVAPRVREYADRLAGRLAAEPLPEPPALDGVSEELERVFGGSEPEQASLDI